MKPLRFAQNLCVVLLLTGVVVTPALGQDWSRDQDHEWCDGRWRGDRERYCEVREITISARELVSVDAGTNGGIKVEGWDRNEIRLLAKVQAWAYDEDDARDLVSEIRVDLDGRMIRPRGPSTGRREGWSVSFELMVPTNSNLELEAHNGGISIADVRGDVEFGTTNGGVTLSGMAGDVRGRTTNGGLRVELDGDEWDGEGLDVQTTNGGVSLYIPDDYSARLVTGTVNGGIRIDFPIMVQGNIGRRITTDLGNGGKTVRVTTTNGGVTVRKM